jgi:hypothetical protein
MLVTSTIQTHQKEGNPVGHTPSGVDSTPHFVAAPLLLWVGLPLVRTYLSLRDPAAMLSSADGYPFPRLGCLLLLAIYADLISE